MLGIVADTFGITIGRLDTLSTGCQNNPIPCPIEFIAAIVAMLPRCSRPIPAVDVPRLYIKARTPQLNGKVERSHRTDQAEFYQLLTYTDDVDLSAKLEAWENFYNYDRPHISLDGKTPYEVMRSLLE